MIRNFFYFISVAVNLTTLGIQFFIYVTLPIFIQYNTKKLKCNYNVLNITVHRRA